MAINRFQWKSSQNLWYHSIKRFVSVVFFAVKSISSRRSFHSEPVKVFEGHTGAVKKAIFMDGKRICSASDDKTAKSVDLLW